MKYLAEPKLDQLSNLLSSAASSPYGASEAKVMVKFELYSVKQIREDRKMVKEREEMYMSEQEGMEEMSFSPEMKETHLSSCFGRLDEKESRKVHYLLVQTLNAAFPEHDFAALQPEQFTREQHAGVVLEQLGGRLLYKAPALPQLAASHSSPLLRPSPGGPGSSPFSSSSPSYVHAPPGPAGDLYKSLCEIVPLDECDVYSWHPSPEYDPHVEPEDGELGDDWYEYGYGDGDGDGALSDMDVDMDMDDPSSQSERRGKVQDGEGEGEAMWGNAGMEIEEEVIHLHGGGVEVARIDSKGKRRTSDMPPPALPPSGPALGSVGMAKRASVDDEMMGVERTGGGLLWSANYFFYSKRNKRILFITTWSRRRSGPRSYAAAPMESAFPDTISSSSMSTSAGARQPPSPLAPKRYKPRTKSRHKPHARPTMGSSHANGSGGGGASGHGLASASGSGTNEQKGFAVGAGGAGSGRLASSAPSSSFGVNSDSNALGMRSISGSGSATSSAYPTVTPGAMSRMTAGGFKPRPYNASASASAGRTGGFSLSPTSTHMSLKTGLNTSDHPSTGDSAGGASTTSGLFGSGGIAGAGTGSTRQSGISAGLASFAASGNAMRHTVAPLLVPTLVAAPGSTATAATATATATAVNTDTGSDNGGEAKEQSGESRVRKNRSESTTPGPSVMRSGGASAGAGAAGPGAGDGGAGAGPGVQGDKRVKV